MRQTVELRAEPQDHQGGDNIDSTDHHSDAVGDAAQLRHELHGAGRHPALHEHPAPPDRDRPARGRAAVLRCAHNHKVSPSAQ